MKRNSWQPDRARGQRSSSHGAPSPFLPSQTDHYQASAPLRIQLQTGINSGEEGGRKKKERKRAAAGISSVSVPGSQPSPICNSNAVACAAATGLRRTRLHLYLLRLGVSDSRWGCGPIRRRLLEDDEWGRLRGAREEWRHRQTGDAHSCLGEWV